MKNKEGGARFVAKVELKQPIVQEISEQIKDAQSVVVVDYRGLTVAQDTELRKQLREAGVIYKVSEELKYVQDQMNVLRQFLFFHSAHGNMHL